MALQQTQLTLTPTGREKGLVITGGAPAVREKVILTLVGAAEEAPGQEEGSTEFAAPEGLTVRVFPMSQPHHPGTRVFPFPNVFPVSPHPNFDYARFPLKEGDAWEVDGQDLKCVLDLNTVSLLQAFRFQQADQTVTAWVTVERSGGGVENIHAFGQTVIRNWRVDSGDPVPGSSALKVEVDELLARFGDHAHKGDAEDPTRKIAHADLEDAGMRTHAEIDALFGVVDGKAGNEALGQEASLRSQADDALGVRINQANERIGAVDAGLSNKASAQSLQDEAVARENADVSLGARIDEVAAALAGKAGKLPPTTVAMIDALQQLPADFSEQEHRAVTNALVTILKGLVQ